MINLKSICYLLITIIQIYLFFISDTQPRGRVSIFHGEAASLSDLFGSIAAATNATTNNNDSDNVDNNLTTTTTNDNVNNSITVANLVGISS